MRAGIVWRGAWSRRSRSPYVSLDPMMLSWARAHPVGQRTDQDGHRSRRAASGDGDPAGGAGAPARGEQATDPASAASVDRGGLDRVAAQSPAADPELARRRGGRAVRGARAARAGGAARVDPEAVGGGAAPRALLRGGLPGGELDGGARSGRCGAASRAVQRVQQYNAAEVDRPAA